MSTEHRPKDEKVFDVKYEAGHSYTERWIRTAAFCPGCGAQDVRMRDDGGDYYVGELYMCVSCGGDFYLPNGVPLDTEHKRNWQAQQRLLALRGESQ